MGRAVKAPKKAAKAPKALKTGVKTQTENQKNAARRQLERRDSDMAVDRILEEDYTDFPAAFKYAKKINGVGFKEALLTALRKAKQENRKLGPKEKALIAAKYIPASDLSTILVVNDTNEERDPKAMKALSVAQQYTFHTVKSLSLLVLFFACAQKVGQRTLVGLQRFLLMINPKGNDSVMECFLGYMRWMEHTELRLTFQKEVTVMKPACDLALLASLISMLNRGVDVNLWWGTVKNLASQSSLVANDVDAVLVVEGQVKTAAEEDTVLRVCSSMLGEKMFGHEAIKILLSRFDIKLQTVMANAAADLTDEE